MTSPVLAFAQADAVGWICLVVGFLVLGAGVYTGLRTSLAHDKLKQASEKLDETKEHIEKTKTAMQQPGLEGVGAGDEARNAGEAASESAAAAQSALEQVQSIVGSLPENLRFAGLLVLVGTVLISVATIQFGGTSLF